MGMESFSFVPKLVHVTSFSAAKRLASAGAAGAQTGMKSEMNSTNDENDFMDK
jgi:hypothetical protein